MTYADEAFYVSEYLPGRKQVIRTGFAFYARQAGEIIDRYTFGRVKSLQAVPEAVQMCCCELAEAIFNREKQQKASGGKTSEKVGTYSVSFATAKEASEAAVNEQRAIVYKWLADTGLCYQGV